MLMSDFPWQEVEKRFPDGIPLLDPIEDMGIKEKGLKEVVRVTLSFTHFFLYQVVVSFNM